MEELRRELEKLSELYKKKGKELEALLSETEAIKTEYADVLQYLEAAREKVRDREHEKGCIYCEYFKYNANGEFTCAIGGPVSLSGACSKGVWPVKPGERYNIADTVATVTGLAYSGDDENTIMVIFDVDGATYVLPEEEFKRTAKWNYTPATPIKKEVAAVEERSNKRKPKIISILGKHKSKSDASENTTFVAEDGAPTKEASVAIEPEPVEEMPPKAILTQDPSTVREIEIDGPIDPITQALLLHQMLQNDAE